MPNSFRECVSVPCSCAWVCEQCDCHGSIAIRVSAGRTLWFTCGFMCANSNVYIHTDSKCITYNNAYTSKHDIGIDVHESHYFASSSAFINHSLNPAKRLFCGGTQRNTAKRLYTGTQYAVVVTGHSNKMLPETHVWGYTTVQGTVKCAWYSFVPLELALAWYEGYTHLFVWKGLQGCC